MNPKAPSTVLTAETKPARVPKLRFPEFRGAEGWKSIPLSRLAIRAKQKNRDEKIGRVLTNSAEFGVVDQRDFFDKDIATQGKLEGYFVVELGSYVYNPRISSTAPVGPISKNKIGTGVMSPLYTVFKFKDDRNDFYEHFFKTTGWHTYMRQASSTGARHDRMAISSDDFMALPLPVPSPDEQQKIAECLSSVDELMAAQARKVDALKTHKKGLMQQLFPTEGETQPRLRFPEFQNAGEWEKMKIGDMLVETQRPIELSDDAEFRLVTVKRRYGGLISRGIMKGREILVKSQFVVRAGDFLISKRQIVHNACGLVTQELDGSVVSNEYSVLTPKPGCSIEYFSWFAMQPAVSASFMNCSVGIVIEKMLFKLPAWLKHEFLFPTLPEQHRIASYLSSLDALITLETQKLEALKTHKKGLMQQLFPSPEETADL